MIEIVNWIAVNVWEISMEILVTGVQFSQIRWVRKEYGFKPETYVMVTPTQWQTCLDDICKDGVLFEN